MPHVNAETLLSWLGLVAFLSLIPLWWWIRRPLGETTLLLPWRWGGATLAFWLVVWTLCQWTPPLRGIADQLWYSAGIVGLCPPLAVLGARRPMSRVWTPFILIPLLLVFAWPAISDWSRAGWRHHLAEAWTLEEPMFTGFCLVLVMSLGNYLGTPLGLSGLLWSTALFLVVAPLCPSISRFLPNAVISRTLAVFLLTASVWWGWLRCRLSLPARTPLDNLWLSYREMFGLVWGKRLQERFNFNARGAGIGFRLFRHGFALIDEEEIPQPGDLTPPQREFAEYTLRWLLRRFVDPVWIDSKLAAMAPPNDISGSENSGNRAISAV